MRPGTTSARRASAMSNTGTGDAHFLQLAFRFWRQAQDIEVGASLTGLRCRRAKYAGTGSGVQLGSLQASGGHERQRQGRNR